MKGTGCTDEQIIALKRGKRGQQCKATPTGILGRWAQQSYQIGSTERRG
jgi:hypothetical protein